MKKGFIIILSAVLASIVVLITAVYIVPLFKNSKSTPEKVTKEVMEIEIPSSAKFLEYTYKLSDDGDLYAAKISVSKEDYKNIKKQVVEYYSEEPVSEVQNKINWQKDSCGSFEWWDLKDEDIVEDYYRLTSPRRPVKHQRRHSIYAVEREDSILLYFHAYE